jgi:hypothetical protein
MGDEGLRCTLVTNRMKLYEPWRYTIIAILGIIHRSVFYLKHGTFPKVNPVSVFRWNLVSWAQSIDFSVSDH